MADIDVRATGDEMGDPGAVTDTEPTARRWPSQGVAAMTSSAEVARRLAHEQTVQGEILRGSHALRRIAVEHQKHRIAAGRRRTCRPILGVDRNPPQLCGYPH